MVESEFGATPSLDELNNSVSFKLNLYSGFIVPAQISENIGKVLRAFVGIDADNAVATAS
ncbi:MAG: hypothetical protein ABSE39_11965 [Candidatus Bathyarchaeia archaeon]|jgi:hypothetical protein